MSDNEIILTPIQKIALDTVAEILDMKRDTVAPCLAHVKEIRNSVNVELMEALRELCRRRILKCHLDINKNPQFDLTNQSE